MDTIRIDVHVGDTDGSISFTSPQAGVILAVDGGPDALLAFARQVEVAVEDAVYGWQDAQDVHEGYTERMLKACE